ncbi:MAG: tetratricopeptide repeat protein [Deltaproteobacteria bacterium]|nr:tetratricopeptide repeat protein [Deltaproteobacteria bacterium]
MHPLTLHAVLLVATLDAVVTPPSQDAQAAFERGRRLYELGDDLKGARTSLDEALKLRPDYAEAYLYRALVTQHDHGVAAARSDFETALKLRPAMKEAHRHFGEALADSGEISAAEAHYRQALALDPRYPEALYLLGKLLRGKGDLDGAVKLLEAHATVAPKGSSHHVLGEIFLERGDDARAEKELELDLAIDGACYESRVNLAGLALSRGDATKAAREYEISLTYHPADARSLSGLGRAYLALGDHEKAVGVLRSALDLAPHDAQVQDALASARRHLRLSLGWPLAIVPTAIAAALAVYVAMSRRSAHHP